MTELRIAHTEIESGVLSAEHLEAAVRAVREDGFVVLREVVAPDHVATLRDKLLEDLEALQARDDAPFNWNTGNIQQEPPPLHPYLFRDVLLNDVAASVTEALLGPGVKNHYYSGNTALPSTQRQPVHADTGHLWRGLDVAHPPAQLVVNIPLVDMSPENGSTEIWPGTHGDTTVSIHEDIKIPPEALEKWRAARHPVQMDVKAGSILIRDIRLWHAGMPNRTSRPRPMIAMIHAAAWYSTGRLRFPKGTEEFFQHPRLRTDAEFVDGPIDYINAPQAYEYKRRS